jgi:diaminopimelate decarboxylase
MCVSNSSCIVPLESKFDCTREQVVEGARLLQQANVAETGLHTMVASNERNVEAFRQTARMMFQLALDVHRATDVRCSFINLGGGIGIPYLPDDDKLTFGQVGAVVKECYEDLVTGTPLDPLRIYLENGRALTGPCGWLVSRVVSLK